MNTVLLQEIARYDKLLAIIFKSIDEIVKVIKGEIMITESTEKLINSLLMQKVPSHWEVFTKF